MTPLVTPPDPRDADPLGVPPEEPPRLPNWPVARWLERHRALARLIPHRLTSYLVWRELLADPLLLETLVQAEAEITSGRWWGLNSETGETTPNPNWPTDGPQPHG